LEYKDYYKTLGVAKDASQKDIERAYRKLARKYHPDVNKDPDAEDRFKEINEANEVLKDPEKRAKYDRFGSAWKQAQHGGTPPPDFADIFSQFGFGGGGTYAGGPTHVEFDLGGGASPFSSFFEVLFGGAGAEAAGRGRRVRRHARPARGIDQEARMPLNLEEAASGGKREIQIGESGSAERRKLTINVPPGVRSGQRLRLPGRGLASDGGPRGDLYLTIEILPHPRFRLEGSDLYTVLPVTPWEAALGAQANVPTLEGDVAVKIPAGTSSGRKIRLRGKGFPRAKGERGDLYAEIRVDVPHHLTSAEKKLFEELSRESKFNPRTG